jgi:hypothetical protein
LTPNFLSCIFDPLEKASFCKLTGVNLGPTIAIWITSLIGTEVFPGENSNFVQIFLFSEEPSGIIFGYFAFSVRG